jgi:hypothetical protein
MCVLGLRIEGRPRTTDGSCEYTKQAATNNRQGVILQLWGWASAQQLFTLNNTFKKEPRS